MALAKPARLVFHAPIESSGGIVRSLRAPVAVALTLLVATGPAAGAATGRREPDRSVFGPRNVNVSRLTSNQAETSVAINPTDPANIVVTSNLATFRGLLEAYSTDGGATWKTQIIADGDDLGLACCDSSLAFDAYGNLFLTYLVLTGFDLPVALSTDGGQAFRVIDTILPKGGAKGSLPGRSWVSFPDQPTIATGPGSVWVTYTGGSRIEAAGAEVRGFGQVGRFAEPEVAVGSNRGHFGDLAVGPHGRVLVVYQDASGEGPGKIYTDLDPDGLGPAGFDRARFVTTTNVGDYDVIPAAAEVTVDAETGLAWDRTAGTHRGRVYLLWTQETPDESNDLDVLVQHSDDNGLTWSPPVRVNDDAGTNSQFDPKIALDQTTGNVAVSWYDCRNDLGTGLPGDTNGVPNDDAMIYASVSVDGGHAFGRNIRVAAAVSNSADAQWSLDFGDYEGLAFEAGSFYPVWADNSNSTRDNPDGRLHEMDVYTARVRVGQSTG